jgi:hypothetical protein
MCKTMNCECVFSHIINTLGALDSARNMQYCDSLMCYDDLLHVHAPMPVSNNVYIVGIGILFGLFALSVRQYNK